MSKKNTLEQKALRRKLKLEKKQKQETNTLKEVEVIKNLYKELYPDFKVKGKPVDVDRIVLALVNRIGKTKTDEFISLVKVEYKKAKKELKESKKVSEGEKA